ncbi:MAG: MFS transporter [Coriobacteriia bacterium]|nr:MFS transporter [Coriobacteriia bacterium]
MTQDTTTSEAAEDAAALAAPEAPAAAPEAPFPEATASEASEATAPEADPNLTAGGYRLPANWLARIVLIWGGYAVSAFAGSAASYACIWYVTETTGSPLALALLYVLAFLPVGLLSPFGGVLADKLNRKAIIITCDAILAASGIAFALWTLTAGPSLLTVSLYCASWGLTSAFRGPAFNATMPLLVPARHLMRINSLDTMLGSISMIAAPALGILLYTTFGLQACILAGGVGALAAVVTMLLAKLPQVERAAEQLGAWSSLKEGAVALADQRGLLVLVVVVSLGMFAYGPIDSLLPLMVSTHFGGDGFAASLLAAVMGLGMLVGAVTLMALNPSRKLPLVIIVAAVIVGAGTIAGGCMPEGGYWGFVGCIGVLAIACAWFGAPLMTLLQKGIAEDKLGRVMGLYTAMSGLAIPVGTALGGVLAEGLGTPAFFVVDGVFILLLAVVTALSPSVRKLM